ncbi:unnamed protein product [Blepharisma stoltei]|uniref:Kinesin-like protein n=1 Tax=Blepharisma stoltei TaxID=1481888 RepID=A0AAU9IMI9_9CILI|nr:unnamed protein product [Blepharisma stoltei]
MQSVDQSSSTNVQVFCRFRPLDDHERSLPNQRFIEILPNSKSVIVHPNKESREDAQFYFDYIFDEFSSQQLVYDKGARSVIEAVMQGFNGTVFAYGQTSSGKTYTMFGPNLDDPEAMGIIPHMITTVFYNIENSDPTNEYTVKVCCFELYLEKIRDLFDTSKENLKIREDKMRGVYLEGLTEIYVSTGEEVHELMKYGHQTRAVGAHRMNNESSRSHLIFSIAVSQTSTEDFTTKVGKLHLIDLAGSEKVDKTGAEGTRLEEAKKINKSLTILGQVITALSEGKRGYIPYRDSKLTRILQDSLGGNSRTSLIITCSPSSWNELETISSLRFGMRAKMIKNTPKVNIESTVGELKLLLAAAKEEIHQKNKKIKRLENNQSQLEESMSMMDFEIDKKYEDVIKELEETRARLSLEISKNSKLNSELSQVQNNYDDLKSQFDALLAQSKLIDEEFQSVEEILKVKEEQIEQLTAFKNSYENGFTTANDAKLKLEQVIIEKDLEIELLRRKLKLSPTAFSEEDKVRQEQKRKEAQEKAIISKYAPSLLDLSMDSQIGDENWRLEKKNLIENLKLRIKQIIDLEIALDDSKNDYNSLENSMNLDAKEAKRRNDHLQRSLEQLTLMYHQLVNQNSALSVEKQILEKKSTRLSEKLKLIETSSAALKGELKRAKEEIDQLKEELNQPNYLKNTMGALAPLIPNSRIKKRIRGGGNQQLLATFAVQAKTYSNLRNSFNQFEVGK